MTIQLVLLVREVIDLRSVDRERERERERERVVIMFVSF